MNFLNDPMAAAFIPMVVVLLLGLGMYYSLAQEESDHAWWIHVLQTLRVIPRPPEPEVPLGTKTNVLYIGPDRPAPPPVEPDPVDYGAVIDRSCVFFKWLSVSMLVLTAIHGFRYYRRSNPYFLWGPKPVVFVNPAQRGKLPDRATGAGGAGVTPFGSPAGLNPGQNAPAGTNPGAPAPPGGTPAPPPGVGMPGSR